MVGTVRWYSAQGFGFVDPAGSNSEKGLYFHVSDVKDRRNLKSGDAVTFDTVQALRGLKCVNMKLAVEIKEENHVNQSSQSQQS